MSDQKEPELPAKSEEFQKFEDLTRRLFAVPKAELDEKIREDNRKGRKRQEMKTNTPTGQETKR